MRWLQGMGAAGVGLALCLGFAGLAGAAVPRVDLGLTQGTPSCDTAKATYKYVITWTARGTSRQYQVNSGNQCHLGGQVCGISNKACYATCSADGACRAEVNACQIGRGSPWIQVYATDYSGYQRITAPATSKCQ